MNDLYNTRLRNFRKKSSKYPTQIELSEAIGITAEYYSRLENGFYSPSVSVHISLCLELGVPSDCFFKDDREDLSLTPEQFQHLMSSDIASLKMLLGMLRTVYEESR